MSGCTAALILLNCAKPKEREIMDNTLIPIFLTPNGYDHADHDVHVADLGGGKYNIRCTEHDENIGIFREDDS